MKREIKFRGRHIVNGEWFYGYLLGEEVIGEVQKMKDEDGVIRPTIIRHCTVDKKSVGQYTGLKDKNGKEIYEDDIVEFEPFLGKTKAKAKVFFQGGCFIINGVSHYENNYEVIGNVYENPSLIK